MLLSIVPWAAILAACNALAASTPTERACDEIKAALQDRVWGQFEKDYTSEVNSYWSTSLRDVKPACVVLPQSAEEVSSAVKVLNKYPSVEFAVKSGGHSPNKRQSSIQDGVLISTRDMSGVTYDEDTGIAHVKPGGEWNDVIGPLDEQGVTVVGGRLGASLRFLYLGLFSLTYRSKGWSVLADISYKEAYLSFRPSMVSLLMYVPATLDLQQKLTSSEHCRLGDGHGRRNHTDH